MTIDELIQELTLEEKAALLGGADAWHTAAIDRLGIPAITMSDGPHGLRKQDVSDDMLDTSQSRQAVCFPSAAGLASSFNRDILYRLGETLGNECLAEDVDIILGPAVNMKRSPLCGRNFEYMSEDPYLAGELGAAYVRGVQSKGVGVSVKHFAANNQEKRRMTVSAVVDDRTLREIYLAAFEKIVKESGPDTIMCSYNRINGVYSSENPWLLNDVLRNEWGFDGFVVSDWGAVCNRAKGVAAGLDLEMPASNGLNAARIIAAVKSGALDIAAVDRAVGNILIAVNRYTHFLDKQNGQNIPERERPVFNYIEDHKTARRIARESMVLLKNDGALPLNREDHIVFIGEFAAKPRIQGGGSSHIRATRVISALEAVRRHTTVEYVPGFSATKDIADEYLIAEAVEAAKHSDTAVIFAGLPDSFESEGYDRSHMNLPACQDRLIREVCRVQPNTVVVLHNGSPVAMPWIGSVNAVLEAYLAGEACGEAVIDLLFGVVSPSGKLAETFPLSIKDTPSYDNFPGSPRTVEYREGLYIGYRYYDKTGTNVLFPFGHGLSYTVFTYKELTLSEEGDTVTATFKLKNAGTVAAAEVPQLYIGYMGDSSCVHRPKRELKGFTKVFLEPGETKDVTISLDRRAFSFYNTVTHSWCVESGAYEISIGSSSRDIRLTSCLKLDSEDKLTKLPKPADLPTYFHGDPSSVPDTEFERLLGHPIPEAYRDMSQPYSMESTLEDARSSRWGGRIFKLLELILKSRTMMGSSGMILASVTEMPFHSLMCMSGGIITEDIMHAIVNILNDRDVAGNFKFLGLKAADAVKKKVRDHRANC